VDISKSVSFGNGTVLDSPEYLEYFVEDPATRVIAMYLEGVKDAKRFLRVLKEVAARKPVVIWKGGRTEDGERAIASHTGSLAVHQAIWDAAVRQCGAVKVSTMEEMVDTLKALLCFPPVRGSGVGITGGSGGQSVAITDAFAEAGLRVPLLTQESYRELETFFTIIGGGYRNPIDTGNVNRRQMRRLLEIFERDSNIDNILLLTSTRFRDPAQLETQINTLIEIRGRTPKPVMAVLPVSFEPDAVGQASEVMRKLQAGNVPAFVSLERGARALRNALEYYRLQGGNDY
jgi:acyl-CoA synthetase (NDP forming)